MESVNATGYLFNVQYSYLTHRAYHIAPKVHSYSLTTYENMIAWFTKFRLNNNQNLSLLKIVERQNWAEGRSY